ncbi:MAG: cation diffusion facilitator family transporter [Methanothrix sp.]|nr:cation diffusion facilitator family transporter [Methanothrix sp.]
MKNHEVKTVERRFLIAILLTGSILAVEVAGSWWTGSLALLSDAAHVFLDIFALGLSWLAIRLATLPADERYSYGFHRFEVVASLANGLTLGFVSLGILVEAYHRLQEPAPVKGLDLLLLASFGLAVNLIAAFVLKGSHKHDQDPHAMEDLNVRSAMLHVLGDAAASFGVIAAALIIWRTGWTPADPIASVVISLIIFASSYRLMRDSFRIMMEGVPSCLRLEDVSRAICSVPGVVQVHDLHVWGVCSAHIILSAHAVIDDQKISQAQTIMDEMKIKLNELFGIEHTTIQLEGKSCGQGTVVCTVEKDKI